MGLNRGVLMTPFHNMALMSPAHVEADVDRHTEVFTGAVDALTQRTSDPEFARSSTRLAFEAGHVDISRNVRWSGSGGRPEPGGRADGEVRGERWVEQPEDVDEVAVLE